MSEISQYKPKQNQVAKAQITEDRPKIHMDYLESKVDDPKVLEENPSANAKSGDRCSEAIQGVHLNCYEAR